MPLAAPVISAVLPFSIAAIFLSIIITGSGTAHYGFSKKLITRKSLLEQPFGLAISVALEKGARLARSNSMLVSDCMNSFANDPRPTPDLFAAALQCDGEKGLDAVAALHWRGSREVLDGALALALSKNASKRARAADILGQLGIPERTFPDQCFAALLHLLSDDALQVVSSAIFGMQHLDRAKGAPHVLPFATHPDDDIRYATAFALGAVNTSEAIAALLLLMTDGDAEVRNWATFGIAQQSEEDSDEIRAALVARLNDDDPDVRYEAICGLGRRRDGRALGFLKAMLHEEPDDSSVREAAAMLLGIEESAEIATSEILGALQRRQRWIGR